MTAFWVIDVACLVTVLTAAILVVRLDNLNGATMALSAIGTVLSLLFVVLHAPDVAHSEAVVGAIALPVFYLLAIGKVRAEVRDDPSLGEQDAGGENQPASGDAGSGGASPGPPA